MIEFFFYPSPNGLKVSIMLEECGLDYRVRFVDLAKGDQLKPDFLTISPNNKIPAIVDDDAPVDPMALFESGAILEYLAEKTGRFLPTETRARYVVKQWLYWQMGGLGPMAGQAHHFRAFASETVPYAIKRYTDEVNRLYGVLDHQLEGRDFIAGDVSVADFACWPWIVPHERQGQSLDDFPNVKRWFAAMKARPGVARGFALGDEKQVDRKDYGFLYGQTAEKLAAARAGAVQTGGDA